MSLNVDGTCNFSTPSISGAPLGSSCTTKSCCDDCTNGASVCSTVKPSLCMDTVTIHFDQFATGATNLLFPGFTITNDQPVTNPLTIFNTAVPLGDTALGTPNSSFGGPGIGSAGAAGKPGENSKPQYQVLIISATNPVAVNPVPNPTGGIITFTFNEDVSIQQVQLLNVTQPCTQIQTYDFYGNLIANQYAAPLGANSFQIVTFCSATPVRSMVITLKNDVSICKIIYNQCPNPALPCVEQICQDWHSFLVATTSIMFTNGSVISGSALTPATIFDTSTASPPLQTPYTSILPPFTVPSLDNVLIISATNPPAVTPVPNPSGGQLIISFTNPVVVNEIDFLNPLTGTTIALFDASMNPLEFVTVPVAPTPIPNAYVKVLMTFPYLSSSVVITLTGPTAVTDICYSMCEASGGGPPGPPVPQVMTIIDFANIPSIVPTTGMQGTYMLLVKSVNPNGASATFMASSAYPAQSGSVARITSAPSISGESVQIAWPANSDVTLYHDIARQVPPASGTLIPYDVIITAI